ncbi:hypothetical protein [Paludisphaera borealis]|uniref:Glycosyltransferase n=1 Tax=Paludisphaera borealis TaxID=1387353 RepID=A0A1U7CJE3_9BACT|nr:hypothetical protein [Paludisphaera borealis]APW59052.1 hypothetical protein BSF38_00466 [Paludisphaera borealis]
MPRNVLLLSATIIPLTGIKSMTRTDPAMRLKDYERALRFYMGLLARSFDSIVFCENSGADLRPLENVAEEAGAGGRVEFVSFQGLDFPPNYGRGFGEFKLVDHAMKHARFLQPTDDLVVWKCTGRYIIRNMEQLVQNRPSEFDVYCNYRNRPILWCDLYLLAWNIKGYQGVIKDCCHRLSEATREDGQCAEEKFRHLMDERSSVLKITPRFRRVPRIEGYRGWDNKPYQDRKALVRAVALKLAPWLWI